MKKFKVLPVALLLSACQTGTMEGNASESALEETQSLVKVCKDHPCRRNIHVTFRTDGEPVDQMIPLYWPRVFNEMISVLPGESFYVEAELEDGKLVNMKEASENSNPDKTIIIKFNQVENETGMMLSIYNPFETVVLKFNMDMVDFFGTPHKTSSCPIMPQAYIFESWPHPIPELIIKNPVAVPVHKMEAVECIY
ncbi:hypothetical protein SAMN05660479_01821 [Microbulbifer thermotolerans]|uniref:hypothetical protein n=1 Tax=Microbulbifer thermotolerans TaxID=252514 RepID=UPI0008F3A6F8|nr:hypothetical protein [Microbulbifer thermotolerans]SFC51597.1 hypothetical protein SAMN05660479_01821 [Microbulbifer thermotolerans]